MDAAAKKAELEKLLSLARVSPEQREAVNAKLAATAEVLAKSGSGDDLDQLSRHLRRFLLPGQGSSGGASAPADLLMNTFLEDRRSRRGKDANPPVADLTEAERRRVDQLDKLRQRNAVGLLDAIHAGLAWLALHQRDDGSFSDTAVAERCTALRHDPACLTATKRDSTGDTYATAATALAVIAFLDFRDQDPNGWFDPYLGRGIEWLRKAQKPDGSFPGGGQYYAGAMALMAMGQAAASTGRTDLREAVAKGLAFFEGTMGPLGGYRYRPNDPTGDLSVTAWVAQATEAARLADVQVPFRVSSGLEIFLGYFWKGEHRFSYLPSGGASASPAPAGMLVAHVAGRAGDPAVTASWRKYLEGAAGEQAADALHALLRRAALDPARRRARRPVADVGVQPREGAGRRPGRRRGVSRSRSTTPNARDRARHADRPRGPDARARALPPVTALRLPPRPGDVPPSRG